MPRKFVVASVAGVVILVILLLPVVPTSSKVLEEQTVTNTLTQTRTILETTSETTLVPHVTTSRVAIVEPRQYVVNTEWQVTWYTITGEGQYGAAVGTQTFPSTFSYNWGSSRIFGQYDDFVAFQADSEINVQRSGPVRLEVRSDDGVRLYVDGQLIIDKWESPFFGAHSESAVVNLALGKHALTLHYYEWQGEAVISFNTDSDVLSWQETTTTTVTQTQIITTSTVSTTTRVVTSYSPYTTTTTSVEDVLVDKTEYISILQYLLRFSS